MSGIALDRQIRAGGGTALRERRGQRPEPGADLDDAQSSSAPAAATMRARTRAIVEEVLAPRLLGGQPVPRRAPRAGSSDAASGLIAPAPRPRAAARDRPQDPSPRAPPRATELRAGGGDHRGVVGAVLGRRDVQLRSRPRCAARPARRAGRGSPRRRRRPPARSAPRARAPAATCAPARRRSPPGSSRTSRPARLALGQSAAREPRRHRGLEAREAEVDVVASAAAPAAARPPSDRRSPPACRSPRRRDSRARAASPTLSNASPAASSRVAPSSRVAARRVDADQRRVAARHQQRQVRIRRRVVRRRRLRETPRPGAPPGDSRRPAACPARTPAPSPSGRRPAARRPDPGPRSRRSPSMSRERHARFGERRVRAPGTMVATCWRDASSGTTPPYGACTSICDATTFARTCRPSSTTAAAVSSHDVSTPSTSMSDSQHGQTVTASRAAG